MATYNQNLVTNPRTSSWINQDSILIFACVVVPIHIWVYIQYAGQFPAWILRLPPWDLIGFTSYILAFALFESVLIFLFLRFISLVFFRRIFTGNIVALCNTLVIFHVFLAYIVHNRIYLIKAGGKIVILLLGIIYLLVVGISFFAVNRFPRFSKMLVNLAEREVVLATIYVVLDILAIAVILFRNV